MWGVLESSSVQKEVGRAPRVIREAYEAWKNVVLIGGPSGLKAINGYWDHALSGEWKGARSSSLNRQWRVVYVVNGETFQVMVVRVSSHDYRRRS